MDGDTYFLFLSIKSDESCRMTLRMNKDVAEGVLLSRFPNNQKLSVAQSTKYWDYNTQHCYRKEIMKCYSLIGFQQYNCWLYFKVQAIALGIAYFDEAPTQSSVSVLNSEWNHNCENISRLQFASDATQTLFSSYYHNNYHYVSCHYFSISLINIWMLQGLLPL